MHQSYKDYYYEENEGVCIVISDYPNKSKREQERETTIHFREMQKKVQRKLGRKRISVNIKQRERERERRSGRETTHFHVAHTGLMSLRFSALALYF